MEKIKTWYHSQKHNFELQLNGCQDTWLLQVSTNQENYDDKNIDGTTEQKWK